MRCLLYSTFICKTFKAAKNAKKELLEVKLRVTRQVVGKLHYIKASVVTMRYLENKNEFWQVLLFSGLTRQS
jgi:hypothetical protein